MLRQRVLSAIVLIPVIVLAIWFGNPWFSIIVAVAALLGVIEFYTIIFKTASRPLILFGILWTLFFIFNADYAHQYGSDTVRIAVTLGLVATAVVLSLLCSVILHRSREKIVVSWLWSLLGVLYIGWLLSYWVLIMNSEEWAGRDWVLVGLFSVFAVDTTAYFVGTKWGRHKLAPAISPAKTWEGAIGGLAGAIIAGIVLSVILGMDVSYSKLVVLGCVIGVFAQLGDLAESKIKRMAAVKEAGSLIPGHGGILDRLDSIVFTGVLVYYCLQWFIV